MQLYPIWFRTLHNVVLPIPMPPTSSILMMLRIAGEVDVRIEIRCVCSQIFD